MFSPGVLLGSRYRLDERIAGGGMGDVWRATDDVLGRTVAVKILLPALLDEPGFAERFRGEARTMATINHPGVVDIYDYGSDDHVAFLVMEYVAGDALSQTLSRVRRLTPARTMALIAQAAEALHAAHSKGIVHHDVKPGNLLVRPDGTLVLSDFGIARSALVGQLTVAGAVLGTASYISPEQAAGQVATPLSDVYGLGIVAYQCLSGRRPFMGDNPVEIAMKHASEPPPPMPADIPSPIQAIVQRAMAKAPTDRWPSAAALGAVARQAAAAAAGMTSPRTSGQAGVVGRSRPAGTAASGARRPASGQVAGDVRSAAPPQVTAPPPRPAALPPRPAAPAPRPAAPARPPQQWQAPAASYRQQVVPRNPARRPTPALRPVAGAAASSGGLRRWLIVTVVLGAIALLACVGAVTFSAYRSVGGLPGTSGQGIVGMDTTEGWRTR
ncbi:serine/threonine-protein kinase [Pilimelia columellifera]|uniref:non-specific serine/threonine protein kinase n=1 Tax=Pilimelia columellifera subsp. columellifera TaxID=706583 RepID=A0ABN3N504_9ACTN